MYSGQRDDKGNETGRAVHLRLVGTVTNGSAQGFLSSRQLLTLIAMGECSADCQSLQILKGKKLEIQVCICNLSDAVSAVNLSF